MYADVNKSISCVSVSVCVCVCVCVCACVCVCVCVCVCIIAYVLRRYEKPMKWSLKRVVGRDLLGPQCELLRCAVMRNLKISEASFCDFMENQHNGA